MKIILRVSTFVPCIRFSGDDYVHPSPSSVNYLWKILLAISLVICSGGAAVVLFYYAKSDIMITLPVTAAAILFSAGSLLCILSIFADLRRLTMITPQHKTYVAQLQQQIKVLQCLCALSDIADEPEITPDKIIQHIAQQIPSAFRKPEDTGVRITINNSAFQTDNFFLQPDRIYSPLRYRGDTIGKIEVCLLHAQPGAESFSSSEKDLLDVIARRLENNIERLGTIERLTRYQSELKEQQQALTEKNRALHEIVEQVEFEKKKIKEDVAINVEKLVLPSLKKLIQKSEQGDQKYLTLMQKDLHALLSSFGVKLHGIEDKLAPREIEICDMIKNGLQTREISELLDISPATVDRHRNNIRKKLGLVNNDVNLSTYLQSLA